MGVVIYNLSKQFVQAIRLNDSQHQANHNNARDTWGIGQPRPAMYKWAQYRDVVDQIARGTLARVLEITSQSCRCEKHTTVVYALEGDVMCYYCKTGNGFAFVHKW